MRWSCVRVLVPVLVVVLAAVSLCLGMQQQNPSEKSANAGPQQAGPEKNSDKKEKKEKKKKKDGGDDALDTTVFSAAVANSVLSQLRDGLEGHSQRLMLSAFDSDKMDGYLRFEDQIQALFDRYEGFRVYFRIAQTTIEGARGIALVDVQLEELPRSSGAPPVRKRTQMRFELERGRKGWKIVDFHPRDFFS